jgi:hypothetical protein
MKTPFQVLSLLLLATVSQGQQLSVGVEGGVPAETPLTRSTEKLPFAIGPTLHLRFNSSFSLQSGFLFHRLGTRVDPILFSRGDNGYESGAQSWRAKAIEIPLLLKYTMLDDDRTWRPFISAGAAIRRTSIDYSSFSSVLGSSPNPQASVTPIEDHRVKWNADPVFSAGVSFRSGRLLLEPQVRYSYWGAGYDTEVRKNQVHFMFGLRF